MLPGSGSIEVICGSMFSGKSEELIRRVTRAKIARRRVQVFKPKLDDRFSEVEVVSHTGMRLTALSVASSAEVLARTDDRTEVVGIDEAQFFDNEIIPIVQRLADHGLRVIVAGLDTDFRGEPFGCMPTLMSQAERVDKLQAICMVCGEPASRTQRLVNGSPARYDDPVVIVGASELYEARCRKHHEVPRG